MIHDAIVVTARLQAIAPKDADETFTNSTSCICCLRTCRRRDLCRASNRRLPFKGVAIRPLFDKSLRFDNCVIIRADQGSRAVNEFGRAFLKKYAPQRLRARLKDLPLPCLNVGPWSVFSAASASIEVPVAINTHDGLLLTFHYSGLHCPFLPNTRTCLARVFFSATLV